MADFFFLLIRYGQPLEKFYALIRIIIRVVRAEKDSVYTQGNGIFLQLVVTRPSMAPLAVVFGPYVILTPGPRYPASGKSCYPAVNANLFLDKIVGDKFLISYLYPFSVKASNSLEKEKWFVMSICYTDLDKEKRSMLPNFFQNYSKSTTDF